MRPAGEGQAPVRRRRGGRPWWWLGLFAVAVVVVAFVSGRRGGTELALAPNCAHVSLVAGPGRVDPGRPLSFRVAGPSQGGYVVSVDGAPVQGTAVSGASVGYLQTPAGPALSLPRCVSPTLTVSAPTAPGPHRLLVQRVVDGKPTPVASTAFAVTGTP